MKPPEKPSVEPPFEPDGPEPFPPPEKARLRGTSLRVIMPNLVTILAICAGLTGIRMGYEGRFEAAVAMVLLAAFLDGIDGRLARLLKSSSRFGAEMDSLADIVNFGVAPALVLYAYLLDQVRGFGWVAALIYAVACGLRLARFNVANDTAGQPKWKAGYFTGVPAPAGAALVLLPVYLGQWGVELDPLFGGFATAYTIAIGFLMVSNMPVWSGKYFGQSIPREYVLPFFLIIVAYVALLMTYSFQTLTLTALAYLGALPFGVKSYRQKERLEKISSESQAS